MSNITGIGGLNSAVNYTTSSSDDRSSLSITDYFQLLSAQLANQDMTSPMSNSELMGQMTQMAMVQSLTAMTETMQTSQAITTQTYAAGLVGQGVTVAVVENDEVVGTKYGVVSSVNLAYSTPVIMLEGDDTEYPLTHLVGAGKLPDAELSEAEAAKEAAILATQEAAEKTQETAEKTLEAVEKVLEMISSMQTEEKKSETMTEVLTAAELLSYRF